MTESFGILICPSLHVMRVYGSSSPFSAVVFSKTLDVYSYHVLNVRSTKHEWSLLTITLKKICLQEIVHMDVEKVLLEPNFDLRQCILRSFKICCIVTHCNASSRGRSWFWMRPILLESNEIAFSILKRTTFCVKLRARFFWYSKLKVFFQKLHLSRCCYRKTTWCGCIWMTLLPAGCVSMRNMEKETGFV
jgi:hypothetical protein